MSRANDPRYTTYWKNLGSSGKSRNARPRKKQGKKFKSKNRKMNSMAYQGLRAGGRAGAHAFRASGNSQSMPAWVLLLLLALVWFWPKKGKGDGVETDPNVYFDGSKPDNDDTAPGGGTWGDYRRAAALIEEAMTPYTWHLMGEQFNEEKWYRAHNDLNESLPEGFDVIQAMENLRKAYGIRDGKNLDDRVYSEQAFSFYYDNARPAVRAINDNLPDSVKYPVDERMHI